jgi:CheY-like chemotaxis protein
MFSGVVLVCEDNRLNQRVITEHLERVGLTVEMAENGQEGVDMVKARKEKSEKPFDLIFMDIHMPVMDGIQAAPLIMQMETGAPVVAMTANIMTGDTDRYRVAGMDDHVGKPFTSQELWSCLLKYLVPVGFQVMSGTENTENKEETKLQKQLKADFVKDNQAKFNEIISAIVDGDISLAHRLAHTLKSNAALIGKPELQKAAADVEASLKGGEGRLTETQVDVLQSELCKALDELAPYLEEAEAERRRTETPAEPIDEEKMWDLLKKLEPLLKSGNSECLNMIDGLRSISGSDELIQQIEDFNFTVRLNVTGSDDTFSGRFYIYGFCPLSMKSYYYAFNIQDYFGDVFFDTGNCRKFMLNSGNFNSCDCRSRKG